MARDEDRQHDTYLKERELLLRESQETRRGLDRSLLTLASGAIAVSFLLLDQLHELHGKWMVVAFWLLMFGCILAVLGSMWSSIGAFRTALANYEAVLKKGKSERDNTAAVATVWLNRVAMVLYIGGVVSFVAFAILNVERNGLAMIGSSNRNNGERIEHGSPPPDRPLMPSELVQPSEGPAGSNPPSPPPPSKPDSTGNQDAGSGASE